MFVFHQTRAAIHSPLPALSCIDVEGVLLFFTVIS